MADDEQPQSPAEPGGWLPPQAPGGQHPEPPPPPPPGPPPPAPPPGPPPPPPPAQPAQHFPPQSYPYPYPQQPGYPPPVYQPLPPQPPNNDAVAGFTCAVVGAALLFFTAGLSSVISLVLGIVAIPYSRKGKRAIAEGKTRKHKDLATSGYVIGIITIVVSVLATVAWVLIFTLVDWDEIDGSDRSGDPFVSALKIAAGLARLLG